MSNLLKIIKQSSETSNIELFNKALNLKPNDKRLKDHPIAKKQVVISGNKVSVPTKYITIEQIEILLTQIFQQWHVDVKECGQLAQSIYCVVRLHYLHPITKEWRFQDGVGAVDIQTAKDASPADLAKINSGAIQKGLPAAKSYAIKDAAQHLGKMFGRDINRSENLEYNSMYRTDIHEDWQKELTDGTEN